MEPASKYVCYKRTVQVRTTNTDRSAVLRIGGLEFCARRSKYLTVVQRVEAVFVAEGEGGPGGLLTVVSFMYQRG